MIAYDPNLAPDAEAWQALDEAERIAVVERYHRDARIPLPKSARTLHAGIHALVETQLTLPDQAVVRETLQRLLTENISRHDAIHAIGTVLHGHIHDILAQANALDDHGADKTYHESLRQLTAQKWLNGEA